MPSYFVHRWSLSLLLALVLPQGLARAASEFDDRSLSAFGRSYFRLELVRETPLQKTQTLLEAGDVSLLFGYRYNLANTWMMGVNTVFKDFRQVGTGKPFSLWTVSHESLYILRIYHPAYFLFGPQFSYMVPARKPRFPVERETDHEIEIGVGVVANVVYVVNPRWFIGLKFERWRGTRTDTLHGLETGISVNVNLE